ncbi:hypothetical protein BO99DRAFT_439069 [Aspergillus violaceofuscus CBS 115571]|uniref:Rhodopsin domain-containing protein n=1 Tax=Aspergillus violaceofuscus (strain CBS 115571) TaxID=1450538 RepID=A0A2V5IX26_ASPV1|nr:hypothetical protein BO99DRAFT_439069 [Aspergillus violaceofuscus CBS 115571]
MAGTPAYDQQNKGPVLLAVMWTLTGLATVLVWARLFIRTKIVRAFGLDDRLIAISMILGLVNVIIATVAVHYGFGRHSSTVGHAATERANMTIDIGWIFGILSFAFPKMGVAALLHRILVPGFRMQCALWGLTGLVMAVAVANILIFFTSCDPPRALWTTVPGSTCRSSGVIIGFATFNGVLSAFTDLSLAIYPSVVLWKLQMSLHKKLALCAALGMGAISACAAIIKTTHINALANVSDATYASWSLVLWTNVEADLVIIASCIPTLQPLLEFLLGKRSLASYSHPRSYPRTTGYGDGGSKPSNKRSRRSTMLDPTAITITSMRRDSQEEILQYELRSPVPGPTQKPGWEIQRTDHIVIEYEMETTGEGRAEGAREAAAGRKP